MHGGRKISARYTSDSAYEEQIVQANISTVHEAPASISPSPSPRASTGSNATGGCGGASRVLDVWKASELGNFQFLLKS